MIECTPMSDLIKIVILEDIPEIAAGLKRIVSQASGFDLVALYPSAEAALLDGLGAKEVDVFMVDLGLPGIDGIGFIRQVRPLFPKAHFVVHTVSESGKDLMAALAAGAVGYILKGSNAKEICSCLEIVAKGGSLLSPRMASRLVRYFSEVNAPRDILTPKELEILRELKTGLTYDQIAEKHFVSKHTVHTHIKRVYRKLNVNTRDEAVRSGVLFSMME